MDRILPIWHNLESNDVVAYSPMLASIVAISSFKGIDYIANEIKQVVSNRIRNSNIKGIRSSPLSEMSSRLPTNEIQSNRFRFLLKLYQQRDRTNLKNVPTAIVDQTYLILF
jgi:hypothetical protein